MGDMPAIPFEEVRSRFQGLPDKWANHVGLTKREMMAIHIASGLISDPQVRPHEVPGIAVRVADAILAELERTKTVTTQQCLRVILNDKDE